MKRMIALLICLMMTVSLAACGEEETGATPSEAEKTISVTAGGLELKFPESWQDTVDITADDAKLSASVNGEQAFELYFNTDEGEVLGTVTGDEYTVIRIKMADSDNPEITQVQEGIGVMTDNLKKDYGFVSSEALEKPDDSTFEIETDVVTLYYPQKWKDKVKVTVDKDAVSFARGEDKLFDIVFKDTDKGDRLGTYNGTPVCVVTYEVKDDEAATMQEDLNVIYRHLLEDENFSDD